MKRLAISLTLLIAVVSSLVWLIPTFAAQSHVRNTLGAHPKSIFALEHQVGKPGGGTATSTSTFSCSGATAVHLLANITEKVLNDAESGQAGNYRMLGAFTRTVQMR